MHSTTISICLSLVTATALLSPGDGLA